jgi:hypothetical protein
MVLASSALLLALASDEGVAALSAKRMVMRATPAAPAALVANIAHHTSLISYLPACLLACAQSFVAGLTDLPEAARAELQQLTPWAYVGNAAQQAKALGQHLSKAK